MKTVEVNLLFGGMKVTGSLIIQEQDETNSSTQEALFKQEESPIVKEVSEPMKKFLVGRGLYYTNITFEEAHSLIGKIKKAEQEIGKEIKEVSIEDQRDFYNSLPPVDLGEPEQVKRGRGRPRKESLKKGGQ